MIQIQRMHRFNLTLILTASHQSFKCEAFVPPLLVADDVLRYRHSTLRNCPVRGRPIPTKSQTPHAILVDERRKQKWKRGRSLILYSSPANADQETGSVPYTKQLFLLCRPINFPIVALFHMMGVHQAARLWKSTVVPSPTAPPSLLLTLLKHPSMLMVMLALLLVTSTSMITNDYYDARNGVDSAASMNSSGSSENEHYHPLAKGEVPFSVAKMFDSYLYAILLLTSAFVPSTISRLMVIGGAITTYLYTLYLKPRTWVKNLSCAALVAMSPVTSGLAAWHVLCNGGIGGAGVDKKLQFHLIFKSPLSFLVVALFAGIMSREILMDITDFEGDAQAGIETIPVRYGKSVAARVALGCSCVSAVSACGSSIMRIVEGGASLRYLITIPPQSFLTDFKCQSMLLAVAGSGSLLWRTINVWKTKGKDDNLCEKAIRESLISVLLVLASFL